MADAKKLSRGETEKAKIWQADYEVLYSKKADHEQFAYRASNAMHVFPFKNKRDQFYDYFYTGIIYDGEIAGKVSGVVPDSPAEKAGIKAGDMIINSSWGTQEIFKQSYNKLVEKTRNLNTYHFNYSDFELYRMSYTRYQDSKYVSPFMSTYISAFQKKKNQFAYDEISRGSKPLIFTVKREKSTKKIEMKPIKTEEVIFSF